MRPPCIEVYLEWILRAWDTLSGEVIAKSFKEYGITNALDGSDDKLIKCFKASGEFPNGRELLRSSRAKYGSHKIAQSSNEADLIEDQKNDDDSNDCVYFGHH
jgi:hypothetical protein